MWTVRCQDSSCSFSDIREAMGFENTGFSPEKRREEQGIKLAIFQVSYQKRRGERILQPMTDEQDEFS